MGRLFGLGGGRGGVEGGLGGDGLMGGGVGGGSWWFEMALWVMPVRLVLYGSYLGAWLLY